MIVLGSGEEAGVGNNLLMTKRHRLSGAKIKFRSPTEANPIGAKAISIARGGSRQR